MKIKIFFLFILISAFWVIQALSIDNDNDLTISDNILNNLNLNIDQTKKIESIRDKSKRDILKLRYETDISRMEFYDEIKKEKSDKTKLDSLIDKISEIKKQIMKIKTASILEIKNILSKEQYCKLYKHINNIRSGKLKKKGLNKLIDNPTASDQS
ncbi:MAG: hypothetical protein HQK79_07840 [Desulfobacterales bacterium]|nr:hypothetical protein [Desulfobacterales bacterium]MBF0396720.1 hypothetical protein [Desulfobacterales bacterium]